MAYFLDERIREACLPAGGGSSVFTLQGPAPNRRPFREAKRFDGSAVQDGDITTIGVVQQGVGAAVFAARLNLAGADTLTLVESGLIYQTTAAGGSGLPAFVNTGAADVFCTLAVPNLAIFDHLGNLLQSLFFRRTIAPVDFTAFLAQTAVGADEAIVAASVQNGGGLSTSQKLAKRLGGLFVQNNGASGLADGRDKFLHPQAGSGRIERVGLKIAPTERSIAVAASGRAEILVADAPDTSFWFRVHRNDTPSVRLNGAAYGHATDPDVDFERNGALAIDVAGASIGFRNTDSVSRTFSTTWGVIS